MGRRLRIIFRAGPVRRRRLNPAVGPALVTVNFMVLACLGGHGLIAGHEPLGSWYVWGAAVLIMVGLNQLSKRAERHYAKVLGEMATLQAPVRRNLLDPARLGPHTVFLRHGKLHIQLRAIVMPHPNGDLWLLYGPAGTVAPPDGEILIMSDHRPRAILLQTEEDDTGRQVFVPVPPATTTPN